MKRSLSDAVDGKGSTISISGEAGIGKTRLIEEFQNFANTQDVKILKGASAASSFHPFLILSKALEGENDKTLFHDQEYTSFSEIFAIDNNGQLVAKSVTKDGKADADVVAGMLTAVQSFVKDSFDNTDDQGAGLGKLEYSNKKILMEHGGNLFLAAVIEGVEHPNMRNLLKNTIRLIEKDSKETKGSNYENMEDVTAIQEKISALPEAKFLVRRDLEGVKLINERIRIADQMLEVVVEMTKERPVLLILEDLHWADESSLFVINYLARNISRESVLVVSTQRPRESDILQSTINKMREENILNEIILEKLESDLVSLIISDMFSPNEFSSDFITNIAERCEGNPFFVIEMLKQMHEERSIINQDGKYMLASENYTIPSSVEDVVHRRLEMLDPDAMALAEYASCVGREFQKNIAFSFQFLNDAHSSLKRLQDTGIVTIGDDSAEFTHAIFHDVIYNNIKGRWTLAYHKNIGEFYENSYKNNVDDVLYELVRHFSKTNEFGKIFDYSIKAGEKAESAYAVDLAIGFYKDALGVPNHKIGPAYAENETNIIERLGDLHSLNGQNDEAINRYTSLILKIDEKRKQAEIHSKISEVFQKTGDYDKCKKICNEGLDLLKDEKSVETAALFRALGWAYLRTGDYDKAVEHIMGCLRIAEALNEKKLIASSHHALGTIYSDKGDFDNAFISYDKALVVMRETDNESGVAGTLNNTGLVYTYKGDLDTALEYYAQSLEIMEKVGDKYGIAATLGNMGLLYSDKGELDKALDFYERSLAMMEKIGDRRGVAYSLINIGEMYWYMNDLEKTLSCNGRSLDICLEMGDKRASIYNYYGLAKANIGLGHSEIALEDAEKGVDLSVEIGAKVEEVMSRRVLGVVYLKMDDLGKSEEEFTKAKAILDEVGEQSEIAQLLYEHANLHKAKGEQDKARELLDKALPIFKEIGMKWWEDKCREMLEEL